MAESPETSEHTNVQERINPHHFNRFPVEKLAVFKGTIWPGIQHGVLLDIKDYLTLVDTTGRIQRQDERGYIASESLPIRQRLGIDADNWVDNTQKFEAIFYKKFHYRRRDKHVA